MTLVPRCNPPAVSTFPILPDDVFVYTPSHIARACGVNEDTVTRLLCGRIGGRLFQREFGRWEWHTRAQAELVCVFISTQSPKARAYREKNFGAGSETLRKLREHLAARLQSK